MASGTIFLTASSPEILMEKPLGSSKIRIITGWKKNLLGIDIDQGAMWESLNGRKGAVQALGSQWGSHLRLPHLKLHSDDRDGDAGELIDGTARGLKRFGVYVYNCDDDRPLSEIEGMYTKVEVPGCSPVVVEFKGVRGPACAVLQVERTGRTFAIKRTMQTIHSGGSRTNQEKIDHVWGYGLLWQPATKPPRRK